MIFERAGLIGRKRELERGDEVSLKRLDCTDRYMGGAVSSAVRSREKGSKGFIHSFICLFVPLLVVAEFGECGKLGGVSVGVGLGVLEVG